MKTIAQLLKHDFTKGLLFLYDSNNNLIYDLNGNRIYYEDSDGTIIGNRPKESCNGKVVEIDGKKYKLTEL